ncbi:Ankyrin-2 (ANK-2) (Ankyrin-B) (Brain ankyrin) [Durusdinium trenchii]|uniref:Ankyrin-2 (ANK-2) (Ankyrin-B) (Brain ankyrin) n=1 Tax=Durusdinium trenchii TaxID=1381693 RepID=A0ABP0N066_9DINO
MPLCGLRRETPLACHAAHLQAESEAVPTRLYPMYTVHLEDALQMSCLQPHEELKSKGVLVEFEKKMGKAVFVSHQWAGKDHPDPTFERFRVLQKAMQRILSDLPQIPLDYVTELLVPNARPLDTQELRSVKLFLWYDYFSCPQKNQPESPGQISKQAQAIESIHAYVAECSFLFALCPFMHDLVTNEVLDASSWRSRGWCRLERTMRELSEGPWIMVKSALHIEITVATDAFNRPIGEGTFAVADDKAKLGPVLAAALKRKMLNALRRGDFVTYRIVRNLQSVHLRGLDIEPELNLIPGFVADKVGNTDDSAVVVAEFFHQNGFSRINEVDRAGFRPLHYAALSGDTKLISALLEQRADLTKTTRKGQPLIGVPTWASALGLCMLCGHNEVAELLIASKAKVHEQGVLPALTAATLSNNAEGVQLLCTAKCDPGVVNLFGYSALEAAAWANSLAAMEELLSQASEGKLSKVLHAAALSKQGGAQAVRRLLEMKANADEQYQVPWLTPNGALFALDSFRYRLGRITPATRISYHHPNATPLMLAILQANYETAEILVTEGARLDLRNAQGFSAADLAWEVGVPESLKEVLNGDVTYCRM